MVQTNLDFKAARERRDTGMQRAADHANRVEPEWSDKAYRLAVKMFEIRDASFLAEDVVRSLAGVIPDPPDKRAWGHIFQRAARNGVIEKIGYAPAATSNCSPKVLWRRVRSES
jgi:hypothetical protein